MNENLNLVEILKDCPKGTKLYSTVLGEVEFEGVTDSVNYPVRVKLNEEQFGERIIETFTSDGRLIATYKGECVLFPSREERDWSKFKPKKDWFVPPCKFKDGDILSYQTVRFATEDEKKKLFQAIKDNGYEWNADTKTLNKLVKHKPKFKVGDKIVNRVNMYMGDLSHQDVISEITEDKYILKDGGYIHIKDQDIWELANDKKQRFDPKTLKPFDKVLVRDFAGTEWSCELFSYIENIKNQEESFVCIYSNYNFCIPYNDKTKHLVGTTKEAPEYYRYWED